MDDLLLNSSSDESEVEYERRFVIFRSFIRYDDPKEFRRSFRLTRRLFEGLLSIIGPSLKSTAVTKYALNPEQKVLIFLRYAATNQFYYELQHIQG